MAVIASSEQFVAVLRKSGLVPEPQIKSTLAGLPAGADCERVAHRFVKAGLLTPFQARCLARGKWRNIILGDKYKVLDHLGDGGMGQVFLAEHLLMKRKVALKVPPAKTFQVPGVLQRFVREARALASLDHPNIVRAHDIEKVGGLYMLSMEYVEGPNLRDYVVEHGPRPVGQACHYIAQAAQGLQHAHEAGWVHRDIKPANLLVDPSGVVKVLDLGLAFLLGDDADSPTRQHDGSKVLGTADFLAPEQAINSHGVDIRADIYGLGATLYFLLTGRLMFECETVAQKLLAHQVEQPTPVCELRKGVTPWLGAVLAKMTEKKPADRYQTPAAVAKALMPFASDADLVPPARSGRSGAARRANATTLASTLNARQRSGDGTLRDVTAVIRRQPRAVKAAAAATAAAVLIGVAGMTWYAVGGKTAAAGAAPAGPSTVAVAGERLAFRAHQGAAESVRFLPDGGYATAGEDRAVRLWGANGQFVKQFDGHAGVVRTATPVPPDGRKFLTASRGGTASLWDARSGSELKRLEAHDNVWWADASPDGTRALTCGQDKTIRLWDLATGGEVRRIEVRTTEIVSCVLFLPDGRRAVSSGLDKVVRLWDLDGGSELRTLELPFGVYRMSLSPDRSKVVIGSGFSVLVWDVATDRTEKFEAAGSAGWIEKALYSPDGRWLIAACSDGTVRTWNVPTGRELPPIRGIRGKVLDVDWARDGKSFAAACGDGTVRVWDWTRLN